MTRLVRVFPRRTKATPNDAPAYFGPPDRFAKADEVHVDCTFTYDKPTAERLAEQWRFVAPTMVGRVAYGIPAPNSFRGATSNLGTGSPSRGGRGGADFLPVCRISLQLDDYLVFSTWQKSWPPNPRAPQIAYIGPYQRRPRRINTTK